MAQVSPLRYGIRRAAGDPALVLAEIGWRWAFGAAALSISAYALGRLLATTHLSDADWLALRSRTPVLIADALTHILRDAWPRLVTASAIVLPSLAVLWILTAGLGRTATVRALRNEERVAVRPILGLGFLRVALALAGVLALMAAFVVAGLAAVQGEKSSPGVFVVVLLALSFLVSTLWSVFNWYLSVAPVFAVEGGRDSLGLIAEAARTVRSNRRAFSSVSSVFGFLRLFALMMALAAGLMTLTLAGTAPGGVVLGLMGLVALGYFAFGGFLYIARLAAYVKIVEDSRQTAAVSDQPSVVNTQDGEGDCRETGNALTGVSTSKLIAKREAF